MPENIPDTITANDLYNLARCPRIVYLDRYGDPSRRVEPSSYAEWIMEQGADFEAEVVSDYDIYVIAYAPDYPEASFAATFQLMQQGVPLIYQGVLLHGRHLGRPDLLERVDGPSALGDFHYRPVDIKSARTARDHHRHQVMFYSYLLGQAQGVAPDGVLWLRPSADENGGDKQTAEAVVEYSEPVIQRLLHDVARVVDGDDEPLPFICSTCDGCHWKAVCLPLAEQTLDVSLLSGIRRESWRALHRRGLGTLPAVARLTPDDLEQIDGIGAKTAPRMVAHAQAWVEGRPVPIAAPRLDPPAEGEVFFDIEGYAYEDTECYYLMGLLVRRDGEYVFEYDLARHPGEEREMWVRFLERLDALGGPVYHYGTYERTAIRRLAETYGADARSRRLLDRCVDLNKLVRNCVALPLRGYSLKQVAPWLGYEWTGVTQAADDSILEYHHWLTSGDEQHLEHVIIYNEDDVRATRRVRDFLLTLI